MLLIVLIMMASLTLFKHEVHPYTCMHQRIISAIRHMFMNTCHVHQYRWCVHQYAWRAHQYMPFGTNAWHVTQIHDKWHQCMTCGTNTWHVAPIHNKWHQYMTSGTNTWHVHQNMTCSPIHEMYTLQKWWHGAVSV